MSEGAGAARREPVRSWRRAVPLALAASALLAVSLVVRGRGNDGPAGEPMRGGASAAITAYPPRDDESVAGDSIQLAWRPLNGATRYVVEVLDAEGRAIVSDTTSDTTHVLRDLHELPAGGDHRWWIRARDADGVQRSSPLTPLRVTPR